MPHVRKVRSVVQLKALVRAVRIERLCAARKFGQLKLCRIRRSTVTCLQLSTGNNTVKHELTCHNGLNIYGTGIICVSHFVKIII